MKEAPSLALCSPSLYGRDYLVDPPPQTTMSPIDGYPRVLLATIPAYQASVTVTVALTPKVVPGGRAISHNNAFTLQHIAIGAMR